MSTIRLHELVVRPEGVGEFVVGRVDTGTFVVLPQIGVDVIDALRAGSTVDQAAESTGADVSEFVEELLALGFVRSIGEREFGGESPSSTLSWLTAAHVRWLFSRPVAIVYCVLLAAGAWAVVGKPAILPHSHDFFWARYPGLVMVGNFALFVVLLGAHELAHLVAARSLGAPARMTLGTRLHHLVVQTDVSALWAVPRQQRYRAYFAGLACDAAALSAFFLLARLTPVSTVFEAAALMVVFGMTQQLCLYMRTDMYFVVQDAFHCGNLFEDALGYLRSRLRRGSSDPTAGLAERERRLVRAYALVVAVGTTAALTIYAIFGIPILVTVVERALHETRTGFANGSVGRAADGLVSLAIELGLLGIFVATFIRTHATVRLAWVRGSVMGAIARRG
jgi:hypothetical protein